MWETIHIIEQNLHSIMYLLIQLSARKEIRDGLEFTFHNVSIDSTEDCQEYGELLNLHSIMYLLILNTQNSQRHIMVFTFHNVSINSTALQVFCLLASQIYIP